MRGRGRTLALHIRPPLSEAELLFRPERAKVPSASAGILRGRFSRCCEGSTGIRRCTFWLPMVVLFSPESFCPPEASRNLRSFAVHWIWSDGKPSWRNSDGHNANGTLPVTLTRKVETWTRVDAVPET